jgi:hypothetical protein
MKCLVTVVALWASALFCGCGGGWKGVIPVPSTNAMMLHVAENWEFTTMSSVTGRAPMTIAGNITQAGEAVSSLLHVNGTRCFSRQAAVSLTGSFDQGILSLTSVAVDGQVVTLHGSLDNAGFLGTYTIKGGCGDGDEGIVVGTSAPSTPNQLGEALIDAAMRVAR